MKQTYKLILLLLLFAGTIQAQPLPKVSPESVGISSQRLQNADEVIENAIASGQIPGAVLAVVKKGKMAYLKAYGNKSVYPHTEAMQTNTVFDVASVTKPVATATALMILVDRGEVRLQDNVKHYIPDFAGWKKADGKTVDIKVMDLMTHTSGLPAYVAPERLQKEHGAPNPDALINYIAGCKRDFEPRTHMQYSCLNYITLQRIIEKVSGKSLQQFAKQNIFDVLGMTHTDYKPSGEILARTAPTQRQKDGSVLRGVVHDPLARIMNDGISGNAGLFADADDLAVFIAALQNGGEWNSKRILSPLAVETMRTIPQNVAAFGRSPGWDVFSDYSSNNGDLLSPNTYGHTGYTGTSVTIDPDNDIGIILLTNRVHPNDAGSVVRLRALVTNAVAGAVLKLHSDIEEAATITSPWTYEAHYDKRIQLFAEEPPVGPRDIIMLGNSISEGGKWSELLKIPNVRNRGISGDVTTGILRRVEETVQGKPDKVFLLIGINDIANNIPAKVIVNNIMTAADNIISFSPQTTVYIQSILPVDESVGRFTRLNGKSDEIVAINKELQKQAKKRKTQFINLYPLFTAGDKITLRKELSYDGLHLNEAGYRIWANHLAPYIK